MNVTIAQFNEALQRNCKLYLDKPSQPDGLSLYE